MSWSARVALEVDRALAVAPWGGIGGGFAAVWIGACIGSVGGLLAWGLLAAGLGLMRLDDEISSTALVCGAGGGALLGIYVAVRLVRR